MGALIALFITLAGLQAHAGSRTPEVSVVDTEGWAYTCRTGRDSMLCYISIGEERRYAREVRGIRQILTVVVADQFQCALTIDRVRCWTGEILASKPEVEAEVPALKNPRFISGGGHNVCALDDSGVHCWSYPRNGSSVGTKPEILKLPSLSNPRLISASESLICAYDDNGLKCWSPRTLEERRGFYFDKLKTENLTRLATNGMLICGQSASDTTCLGGSERELLPWENPMRFINFYAHLKRDFEGLDHLPLVNKQRPEFNLDQIDYLVDVLTKVSPPTGARFFATVNSSAMKVTFDDRDADHGRYLILRLIEPAVLSNTSNYFTRKFLPAYKSSLASIEADLGIREIAQVPHSDKTREAALLIMQAAFTVMLEFVDAAEKETFAHIPRLIGKSILSKQSAAGLLEAMDKLAPNLQELEKNSRAAFLINVIQNAQEFIRGGT